MLRSFFLCIKKMSFAIVICTTKTMHKNHTEIEKSTSNVVLINMHPGADPTWLYRSYLFYITKNIYIYTPQRPWTAWLYSRNKSGQQQIPEKKNIPLRADTLFLTDILGLHIIHRSSLSDPHVPTSGIKRAFKPIWPGGPLGEITAEKIPRYGVVYRENHDFALLLACTVTPNAITATIP